MSYKIKGLFTNIVVIAAVVLLISVIFQVLVYAIPVIFIIWGIRWTTGWVRNLKGTVHKQKDTERRTRTEYKNIHIEREKENFDYFSSNSSKVVDVEYEELK